MSSQSAVGETNTIKERQCVCCATVRGVDRAHWEPGGGVSFHLDRPLNSDSIWTAIKAGVLLLSDSGQSKVNLLSNVPLASPVMLPTWVS